MGLSRPDLHHLRPGELSNVAVTDQPRHANGTFAEHSLEAVYAEIKRLDQLRTADQLATATALTAAEKATGAALTAAKEAVVKAEANQQRVNEGQNEFRGTLKDQAAMLMPRTETESLVRELRVLIDLGTSERSRLVAENQTALADIRTRLARTASSDAVTSQAWKYLIAAGTLLIGVAGVVLTIITVTRQ